MKPSPVPVSTACSVCGLPWEGHGAEPTVEKCVQLLKAEVSRLKLSAHRTAPSVQPWPTTTPYRGPLPQGGWIYTSTRRSLTN